MLGPNSYYRQSNTRLSGDRGILKCLYLQLGIGLNVYYKHMANCCIIIYSLCLSENVYVYIYIYVYAITVAYHISHEQTPFMFLKDRDLWLAGEAGRLAPSSGGKSKLFPLQIRIHVCNVFVAIKEIEWWVHNMNMYVKGHICAGIAPLYSEIQLIAFFLFLFTILWRIVYLSGWNAYSHTYVRCAVKVHENDWAKDK